MIQKFEMTDKEFARAKRWERAQLNKHKKRKIQPLTFEVIFTLTGIGLGVSILDTTTGEVKNVTDYDSW